MENDYYSKRVYIEEKKVTVDTNYRLNFDADRTCGFTRVFPGKVETPTDDDELYEIYMELHECGLTIEQVEEKANKIIEEIKTGKLDVSF